MIDEHFRLEILDWIANDPDPDTASLLGEPHATIPNANNTVNAPILALDTNVLKRLALYNAFDV